MNRTDILWSAENTYVTRLGALERSNESMKTLEHEVRHKMVDTKKERRTRVTRRQRIQGESAQIRFGRSRGCKNC